MRTPNWVKRSAATSSASAALIPLSSGTAATTASRLASSTMTSKWS
jgi:hypothetical protein